MIKAEARNTFTIVTVSNTFYWSGILNKKINRVEMINPVLIV